MERRAHWAKLRPGDTHGIEGVDVEDIETAASVHQHLGEALLADDGVEGSDPVERCGKDGLSDQK